LGLLALTGGTLTGALNEAQGADIASAGTVNLTTATGNYVHITGTTTITAITLAQGAPRTVVFDGALTLTNGASLLLPTGANITTAAGDTAVFRGEASSVVRCVSYTRKNGTSVGISSVTEKIQSITASVAVNALTITLNPTTLDFRDATLTSGTVNTRTVAAAISLVISSGSTLGTGNNVLSCIAILAIDNAGTVELAAVNVAGGVNLDETGLITTVAEGGAGAADSALVIYSTTARTSVPYRVVGYVESTQATAGTWATAPSKIQGAGGQSALSTSLNAQGSAPMFVCRAWVNFNGTGTVAIRASGNVSSITDNGVGLYTVNFTTGLQDASYTTCGIAGNTGSTGAIKLQDAVSPTPSAVAINVLNAGGTANLDTAQVHVAVFR
jgi:hypothetical protein